MPRGEVEFMHQVDGIESLDRYFQRTARRYATFRVPRISDQGNLFVLQDNLPRTERATRGEAHTTLTQVLSGFYYRVNETFLVYGGSDEQHFIAQYGNQPSVEDTLSYSSTVVRNSYVHDETNPARNATMCSSNNYWNIYALHYGGSMYGLNCSGVMCLGCGMGGTINPITSGVRTR